MFSIFIRDLFSALINYKKDINYQTFYVAYEYS